MKVYVASKYQEKETVRHIYNILGRMGHEITVDWTDHIIYPNDVAKEKLSSFAQDDVQGVRGADLLICLMLVDHEYKGLWVEMGIALGKGIPISVIGDKGDSCIFMNHPSIKKFKDIEACMSELENVAVQKKETH